MGEKLPETKQTPPKNQWLEDEFPSKCYLFRGKLLVSEIVCPLKKMVAIKICIRGPFVE